MRCLLAWHPHREKGSSTDEQESRVRQAQAEGLTLRMADSKTGYFGVTHQPGKTTSPSERRCGAEAGA